MVSPDSSVQPACRGGSIWQRCEQESLPADPRAAEERRLLAVQAQLATLLSSYGVASQDLLLLMPSSRRVRTALRRQQLREEEQALHADPQVCDLYWRGCPAHGDTLRWPRWRGWHCLIRRCSQRLALRERFRHCAQPSVTTVAVPGGSGQEQERVCAGHLASERAVLKEYARQAAEPPPCAMTGQGCPVHGELEMRRFLAVWMRCTVEGCSFRISTRKAAQCCDQPATAVRDIRVDIVRYLCPGHIVDEHRMAIGMGRSLWIVGLAASLPPSVPGDPGGDPGRPGAA